MTIAEPTDVQEVPSQDFEPAKPEEQHRWLQKLVGEWTYEMEMKMPVPDGCAVSGVEVVRPFGDLWIMGESTNIPGPDGIAHKSMVTLGYDSAKKKFVGTWLSTMMTFMWNYEGELDAAQRVLPLNSEGPSMEGDGTTAQYQDVVEIHSDDYRTMTGRSLDKDGKWNDMMTVHYRRVKK